MKKPIYITEPSIILKKQNTIYVVRKNHKVQIPIQMTSDIFCMAPVTVKSGAAIFLMKLGIPVHFFTKYGTFRGSLHPKEALLSGKVIIAQTKHHINENQRMFIAKKIVEGIHHNINRTLLYYERKGNKNIKKLPDLEKIEHINEINELLQFEGECWKANYSLIDSFSKEKFIRSKRPPKSLENTLVSYGNTILYSIVVGEIYHTYLTPTISYLHEPSERRYSLALDIADIFKPLLVMRPILTLLNKNQLKDSDFKKIENAVFLSKTGKKKFCKKFDETLHRTIKHKTLKTRVTYRRLIRLELYKLVKHVLNDKEYTPFKLEW